MKRLYFLCVIVIFSQTAYTQTRIAVKGGWNHTWARIYDKDLEQPDKSKDGFNLGILFKIPFENALHFSPWIAYSRRGYSYTPLNGFVTKYDNTIHYIDLVPALSYDFPIGGSNIIAISAGPQLGIALSGTEIITAGSLVTTRKMKFSTSGDYSLIDLGLNSTIRFTTKKLLFEAGFQLGLANINNNAGNTILGQGTFIDPRNIRHRMFSLNIGYFLK